MCQFSPCISRPNLPDLCTCNCLYKLTTAWLVMLMGYVNVPVFGNLIYEVTTAWLVMLMGYVNVPVFGNLN